LPERTKTCKDKTWDGTTPESTDFLASGELLGGQNYTGFYSGMSSVKLNFEKPGDECSL
jgi:hypothetical protein